MRTFIISCFILLAAFAFQGCITSLHPLYTSKDLTFDTRLLGTWHPDGSGDTWKIENLMEKQLSRYKDPKERKDQENIKSQFINRNTYLLTCSEKGKEAEFLLNLVRLDNELYIDLYPGPLKEKNELLEDHYLPVHSYAKIKIGSNGFELSFFNGEQIYKLLSENRIKIQHEDFDYYKVITASTADLQKFVTKYADNKDFFMSPVTFKKTI
ncbi:hypothetical protein [Chitinophaga sp. S165]|uniref:hypothetical protein n=1 Tax=Chitinophaga sp. S165 TaxID=2135462 RepID=UPI000D71D6CB|nr:hypothetical protein [Chitinophaga sp. S165]PWV45841.1 hypothetical protein C7475_11258 [Chitinophaga sp. S165]